MFDPVINRDGPLYLFTAETYLEQGFTAALNIYPWPFFSILIAGTSQLTGLPLHIASHIIVSLCFFIGSYAFVRLVGVLGGSKKAQCFALIIILFHPLLADYRSSSVRDPGMWAFMLLSLQALIRYSQQPALKYQLGWTVFITMALLFRVEAFAIALLAPLSLLATSSQGQRLRNMLRFVSLPLTVLLVISGALLLLSPDTLSGFKLSQDLVRYADILSHLSDTVADKSVIVADQLLLKTAKGDANYAVVAVFFAIFAVNVIRAITPLYLLAFILHWLSGQRLRIAQNGNIIIATHIAILAVYLFLFTTLRQFTLERYSFQMVLILLLYLPFVLETFWQWHTYRRVIRVFIVLILSAYTLDTVINSDYKKAYIDDAAQWLHDNPEGGNRLLSNHTHLAYFGRQDMPGQAGRYHIYDLYPSEKQLTAPWRINRRYAYHSKKAGVAALRARINEGGGHIIKEFSGPDRGRVFIFTGTKSKPRRPR